MKQKELTQERLKELMHYDRDTGIFTWKVARGSRARIGDVVGSLNKRLGYRMTQIDGQVYYLHRLAFLYVEGVVPKNIKVDHINRNKTDNRWVNLRLVSNECNARNCSLSKNNKSGIIGVSRIKTTGRFRASIFGGSGAKNLGHFKTKKDAAIARWEAEVMHNFPNCNTTSSAFLYLKKVGAV